MKTAIRFPRGRSGGTAPRLRGEHGQSTVEFAFLLPGADAAGARRLAERACAAVRGLGGPVTASVGVATFPTDGSTSADVLVAADRACFVAKRAGRDRVASAAEGLALAAEFRPQAPTPVDSEVEAAS